jgi:hypothetical protein
MVIYGETSTDVLGQDSDIPYVIETPVISLFAQSDLDFGTHSEGRQVGVGVLNPDIIHRVSSMPLSLDDIPGPSIFRGDDPYVRWLSSTFREKHSVV